MQFFHLINVLALGLSISATPVTPGPIQRRVDVAQGNSTTAPPTEPFPFAVTDDNINSLVATLSWIENLPNDVILAGPEAVKKYCSDHSYFPVPPPSVSSSARPRSDAVERDHLDPRVNPFELANCIASITRAILEGLLPASKILRVKELLTKGTSVFKVAKALLKARSWSQLAELGPEVYELALVFSGVGGIVTTCFNAF